MILRQGKFYENDKIIPLTFGDNEQIKLIREQLRLIKDLEGGLLVEIDYQIAITANIEFRCSCGQNVWKEIDGLDEGNEGKIDMFIGTKTKCLKCGTQYKFTQNEDGDLIVKIENK